MNGNITIDNNYELDETDIILLNSILNNNSLLSYILLGIIGSLVCVIGILSCLLSIILIIIRFKSNKYSTYVYLIALSISDLIGLILTIFVFIQYTKWPYQQHNNESTTFNLFISYIRIYIYPLTNTFQVLSVWLTLGYTIDRYLYVCHPYLGSRLCTKRNALKGVIFLYILSFIYTLPLFFERELKTIQLIPNKTFIITDLTSFGSSKLFFKIYHFYFYSFFVCLLPFGTIAILNIIIIINIIKSNRRHNRLMFDSLQPLQPTPNTNNNNHDANHHPNQRASNCSNGLSNDLRFKTKDITILILMLVFVFIICQLPSTILRMFTVNYKLLSSSSFYLYLLDISNFLIVFNSLVNCILYVLLSKNFRNEFLKLFFNFTK